MDFEADDELYFFQSGHFLLLSKQSSFYKFTFYKIVQKRNQESFKEVKIMFKTINKSWRVNGSNETLIEVFINEVVMQNIGK